MFYGVKHFRGKLLPIYIVEFLACHDNYKGWFGGFVSFDHCVILRWFPSFALRILIVHELFVISARN